jgi:SNF family Na+-dependent transporter
VEDNLKWQSPQNSPVKGVQNVLGGNLEEIVERSEMHLTPKNFDINPNSSGDSGAMSMQHNFDGQGSISQDTHNMQDESEEHNTKEGNFRWDNDMQFWVMYLGQTIGFGSIWRFPSVIYHNGGSAF